MTVGKHRWSKSMPKALVVLCALLALGVLVAACGGSEEEESGGSSESGPIKIGASLSLTGEASSSAKLVDNGYKMWAEQVNSEGGIEVGGEKRKVELLIKDDASNSNTAVQLVDQLISEEHVNFLLSPWGSSETNVVAPITERNKVIMIAPEAAADEIWEHGYQWLFGILPLGSRLMEPILDLAKEKGIKKVAVLATNETFPLAEAEGAKKHAEEIGMEVVSNETYPPGTSDDGSIISRLEGKNPEMVLNSANTEDAVTFVRALYQRHFLPKLVSLQGVTVEPEFLEAVGKEAEGLTGDAPWVPQLEFKESLFGTTKEYNAAYEKKFNEEPTIDTAAATSAGEVLQQAIEAAETTEPDKVREQLQTATFQTVFGPVKFAESGVNELAEPYAVQRQGEELPVVAPAEFATGELQFIGSK